MRGNRCKGHENQYHRIPNKEREQSRLGESVIDNGLEEEAECIYWQIHSEEAKAQQWKLRRLKDSDVSIKFLQHLLVNDIPTLVGGWMIRNGSLEPCSFWGNREGGGEAI